MAPSHAILACTLIGEFAERHFGNNLTPYSEHVMHPFNSLLNEQRQRTQKPIFRSTP